MSLLHIQCLHEHIQCLYCIFSVLTSIYSVFIAYTVFYEHIQCLYCIYSVLRAYTVSLSLIQCLNEHIQCLYQSELLLQVRSMCLLTELSEQLLQLQISSSSLARKQQNYNLAEQLILDQSIEDLLEIVMLCSRWRNLYSI